MFVQEKFPTLADHGDEVCDDGVNDGSYGSCQKDCSGLGPRCGDALIQKDEGEKCDDGVNLSTYGDGILQEKNGEGCDDGNTVSGDGCSADCKQEIIV